ncbi:sucrase ferredoxin [Corynebacterium sp. TAE3-ERU2]|uniref:sucrase ferredoxin n=1 Tax=Corynebacterium sp. TAE3-ERU2 TaxID=2849497 RepID=UPI001C446AC9|nr:sucrase ferredoxin [Corynebacterium sp. TAE3-ERU2]MBV7302773.1 sucrase ferredoxin [Corynebacterium sp. TAE3-ERU2]
MTETAAPEIPTDGRLSCEPEQMACSELKEEPIEGTAKAGQKFVLFEHHQGWSRDVLDGGSFGGELSGKLSYFFGVHNASFQLIRPAGRPKPRERYRVFIIFTGNGLQQPVVERLEVSCPQDLLKLNLDRPLANGGQKVTHPLVLVCTHGKRDKCCAIKGRPLAAELAARAEEEWVWETSHMKGHRFAATLMLMPWGYSYAYMDTERALAMLEAVQRGELYLPQLRGRGCFDAAGQVAEILVARSYGSPEIGSLYVEEVDLGGEKSPEKTVREVSLPDGSSYHVFLERRPAGEMIPSCGKPAKKAHKWVGRVRRVVAES